MATTTDEELKKPGMALGYQADRNKYWSELENDERIERLRTLVKSIVSENNSLRKEMRIIKEHIHDKDGKAVIVKPLRDEYDGMSTLAGSVREDPEKVYI